MRKFAIGVLIGLLLGGSTLAVAAVFSPGGGAPFSGGTFPNPLQCTAADTETAPCYSWDPDTNTGMFNQAGDHIGLTVGGNEVVRLDGTTLEIETSINLGTIGSTDVQIARDAANILAMRNGAATAQEVRIYNTDSGADDEFGSVGWANEANEFHIVAEATGAGTARSMTVGTTGVASLLLRTDGTDQWQVDGTGNLFPVADAQENLGSAGVAPLDLFVSDQILMTTAGLAADPSYSWNGDPDTGMYSAGGGQIGFAIDTNAEIFFNATAFRPAAAAGLDLGSATNEWGTLYLGDGTATIQLGLAQDVTIGRGAANRLDLGSGDSLQLAGAGTILNQSGSAGLPSYTFSADTTTGMWFTTDNVNFSAAGDDLVTVSGGDSALNPFAADSAQLGSATNEWSSLYLADDRQAIFFGTAQDIVIGRDAADQFHVEEPDNTAQTVIAFTNNTVNASAAASEITCTSCIPAGSLVLGVTTRVTTAFGTTNGVSSLDIGDNTGGQASRLWGNDTGITLGTTTTIADFTVVNPAYYLTADNVVINANGGTFDATGQIRVMVHYIRLDAPAS